MAMFDSLTDKLADVFKGIRGHGKLTEENIDDAVKEIRKSFLEADVNFKVVKSFVSQVKEKALGEKVMKSLTPGQHFVKIVHDEMVDLLGGSSTALEFTGDRPYILMMVGLHGSGKTTSSVKLALKIKKDRKMRPLLVPADVYRPAAIEQLKQLAKQADIDCFDTQVGDNPVAIAARARIFAEQHHHDLLIIDTAGRLQIDEELMAELAQLKRAFNPSEILFVADAMTGQEAVNVADRFNQLLDITGIILTKMDGDTRGGAALSIKAVTQKPLKFIGMGEKIDQLEVFHPDRIASRILGMGDIMTLAEKAQDAINLDEAQEMQRKMRKAEFSLQDFYNQLQTMKKLGSIGSIMGMIPGMGKVAKALEEGKEGMAAEKELRRIEGIICSMTPKERVNPGILNGSRRRRIAVGSGTSVQDINRLMKQFLEMKKMMKGIQKMGMGKFMKKMKTLSKQAGDGELPI